MTESDPNDGKATGNGRDQPTTKQHPVATALQSIERHLQATRDSPTQYEREQHTWAIRTGKGVIVYTFLTFILMAASVLSLCYSRRQAEIADRTMRSSQRAWVSAENIEIMRPISHGLSDGQISYYAAIILKNSGPSIARRGFATLHAYSGGGSSLRDNWNRSCDEVDEMYRREPADYPRPQWFVIAPNSPLTYYVETGGSGITDQEALSWGFWQLGCIVYEDQFQTIHHTRFCFLPSEPMADSSHPDFRHCNAFEDAD